MNYELRTNCACEQVGMSRSRRVLVCIYCTYLLYCNYAGGRQSQEAGNKQRTRNTVVWLVALCRQQSEWQIETPQKRYIIPYNHGCAQQEQR
jgi:hypothetical protein